MLINLSNHPVDTWKKEQLDAAAGFGEIVDIPFPAVDENGDESYIKELRNEFLLKIRTISEDKPCAIHIMGEHNLTYSLVRSLNDYGYTCLASTSHRIVVDNPDGSKTVIFEFRRFREY